MEVLAVRVVFGGVIAEKTEVNEIGRGGQELERREIAFVQRARIGPDPADSMFFHETDVLGPMPARIAATPSA